MVQTVLETKDLSQYYGSYKALSEIDLELSAGELVLLTGPNGAGKSTLLHCLSGLQAPTRGEVLVEGFDFASHEVEALTRLAFVPDVPRFYSELTAWEHLQFIAACHHALEGFDQRAEKLLKNYQLWDARNLFPHHYSRGMRLKLGLLMAFIRPFKVLLLDEPTSALDAEATDLLVNSLLDYKHTGAAILISTHHLSLLQSVSDRTLSLRQGILAEGNP
jgi:ABC-2 type transport system ATP-binding protein